MNTTDQPDPQRPKGTPVPPRSGKKGTGPVRPNPPRRPKQPRGKAARQAAQHRRRNLIAGGGVACVVVIVALVVGLGLSSKASGAPRTPLDSTTSAQLQGVPVANLVDAATSANLANLSPAQPLTGAPLKDTATGKPEMLFIGAEFCPICATERWPMMVALSQFGQFTNLQQTRSAERDGDIATLSFYGSHYSSPYLVFTPVETETNIPTGPDSYKLLQTPTKAQEDLWYTLLKGDLSFPFVDIGGKYLLNAAQFSDTTLSGLDFDQIAADVGNNSSTIGQDIDASAAAMTKYICGITGDKPANVCTAVANVQAPVSSSSSGSSTPAG